MAKVEQTAQQETVQTVAKVVKAGMVAFPAALVVMRATGVMEEEQEMENMVTLVQMQMVHQILTQMVQAEVVV
jgi:hypothetical protein